jgi:5'-deoxynucleotidase YfbR-like HD superfamily hydrolase
MFETSQPTGIQIHESYYSFSQLHRDFAKTDEGQELATQVRWDRYRFTLDVEGRLVELIDKQSWLKLFGADANNLEHMPHTYGIARWFGEQCKQAELHDNKLHSDAIFDSDDLCVIFGGAIVHDRPEIKHGDVTYDYKNDETHDDESKTLSMMLGINETIEEDNILRRMVEVTNTKKRDDTKVGRAFNTIEHIGYLRTGLNAWKALEQFNVRQHSLRINLQWLTQNVLLNSLPKLILKADIYPPVRLLLDMNHKIISEAFQNIQNESFECYQKQEKKDDPDKYRQLFEESKRLWAEYREKTE